MISLKNAPRFLYIVSACQTMLFILPVIMLFYGFKGVSKGDFFLIQGLAGVAVFLLEIPSGYIADLLSRKITIIFGSVFWIIGYLFFLLGEGFWFILVGELIFSMAISFVSGTIEAYLYDLLKKDRKEKKFHDKLAKLNTYSDVGLLIATLSGSFIYEYLGPNQTILFSIYMLILSILIMLVLPDVPEARRQVQQNESKLKDAFNITKQAWKNIEIKYLMLFRAAYGALTLILMWGLQSVMIATHIPVFMFGIIMGINALCRTLWSAISGKVLTKSGLNKIIFALCVIVSLALFGAVISVYLPIWLVYVCLGMMILGSGSIQLAQVAVSTLINHRIDSTERATVLSVKSMVERLFSASCLILLKPLFDYLSVSESYGLCALILLPIFWYAVTLSKLHLKLPQKHT